MTAQTTTAFARRWAGKAAVPGAAHPAPEVTCRPAREVEIPMRVRALRDLAEENGWTATVTFARGTLPGRKPRVVTSIALRMRHPAARQGAVGIWHDGLFAVAWRWLAGDWPRVINATQLRAWVTTDGDAS